jgi:hypothetical protein
VGVADLLTFVCSDGHKTATAGDTQDNPNFKNPVVPAPGVDPKDGTPTDAPRHFSDNGDVQRFVATLPEVSRGPATSLFKQQGEALDSAMRMIQQYGSALRNISVELEAERTKRVQSETEGRRERYRAELVALRTRGCMAVNSPESIDNHLKLIMALPTDDERQLYLDTLKAAPTFLERKGTAAPVSFRAGPNGQKTKAMEYAEKFRADPKLRAELRRAGIEKAEEYGLMMAYADMDMALGTPIPDDGSGGEEI